MNLRKYMVSLILLFLVVKLFSEKTFAYQQTDAVCYSQCAAYKFGWKGDFCWDLFTNQCSIGSSDMVSNMISLVKDTTEAMATGKLMTMVDVSYVFKAMFVCKPLIEDCIVPQLTTCESTCKNISNTYYAPNLSAGNAYGSLAYQNVFYDEENKQVVFKVINNGPGYAWDVDVEASWGHTNKQDKVVTTNELLFSEKIPELLFLGARVGSPKSPSDAVTDFLIDESNLAGFLSKYKSDADNHYIPPVWYKYVPFTAPEGEYSQIVLKVDPNQVIPESNELDNSYVYEIDNLPTPISLSVENLTFTRTNALKLTDYLLRFDLKNVGEEGGNMKIKLYDGNFDSAKLPLQEQTAYVPALGTSYLNTYVTVDVSNGGTSCNASQKFTLVVFDDAGLIKTRHEFNIPLYAGSVNGRVEDLFGKKVVGATVTASSGQSAVVDEYGYYHLKGMPTLGRITLTVTHPNFSVPQTNYVNLEFKPREDKCHVDGLAYDGVNFVLQDKEVVFTVSLKDTSGNFVNGYVLASSNVSDNADVVNKSFRLGKEINGSGELGSLQPGEYMFTVSAGGYKTMAQTVSAVPDNQNLEFVLEPLLGRSNDGSLEIQAPKPLWQFNRGDEILSHLIATKDGKRVILYTSKNKNGTGKIYFFDSLSGGQLKVVNTPSTAGASQACLSASYDGNTTALLVRNTSEGVNEGVKRSLMLFNNQGDKFAETNYLCATSGCAVDECAVSHDGYYVFPGHLINKGLYQYSRLEIEGIGGYSTMGYSALGPVYFLHGNGLIAGCKSSGDQCAMTIAKTELTRYANLKGPIRIVDSSFNDRRVIFGGYAKLFVYAGGTPAFEKEVNAKGREPSASISMGASYIIYTTNDPKVHNADFKIVTADNKDVTPSYTKDANEDVLFVHANDKGLFYMAEKGTTLTYYQVGKYSTEYTPGTSGTNESSLTTTNLSRYVEGTYLPVASQAFANLQAGEIYLANQTVNLALSEPDGSLKILEGTLFSVDQNHRPILLKGQLTADFASPAIVYALKFDRFDMDLFQIKLKDFLVGGLADSEFFVIKNIHTKYEITNLENSIVVSALKGAVNVKGEKLSETVLEGKMLAIDGQNSIKELSNFNFGSLITFGLVVLGALVAGILAFIFYKKKTLTC